MLIKAYGAGVLLFATLLHSMAFAQSSWPERPVSVVIPFAAGGGADALARIVFDDVSRRVGQPFNLDFRPGASGITGTHAVTQAEADGYTLLFTSSASVVHASFRKNVPYDPVADLTPVVQVAASPSFIAAHIDTPYDTFDELLEHALQNPGKVNALLAGLGGIQEEGFADIRLQTGAEFNLIPYSGTGELVADLLSGVGDISLGSPASFVSGVKDGKLKFLTIMAPERFAAFPDVPTVDEGDPKHAGIYRGNWFMVFAPTGTPDEIVQTLNEEIRQSLKKPEVEERLNQQAFAVATGSPRDAAALVERDIERLGGLIESGFFALQ